MYLRINAEVKEKIYRSYTYGDLRDDQLIFLLENKVSPGALRGRNELIRLLKDCNEHRNLAAHDTGSLDGTMHYTIFIDGAGYHLRIDKQGNIFQITGRGGLDLGVIAPWVPPGAES